MKMSKIALWQICAVTLSCSVMNQAILIKDSIRSSKDNFVVISFRKTPKREQVKPQAFFMKLQVNKFDLGLSRVFIKRDKKLFL